MKTGQPVDAKKLFGRRMNQNNEKNQRIYYFCISKSTEMKFTFFKIPRHRQFNYSPMYYDTQKEERKERERSIRKELGLDTEEEKGREYVDRIRGGMRRKIKSHFEVTRKERKKSNLRLIIILIALMILFYYLLNAARDWYDLFLQ